MLTVTESKTLKMTTAQVVETSVTVNNNSPIQDYVHPDDQTQPTFVYTFCSMFPTMVNGVALNKTKNERLRSLTLNLKKG